MQLAKVIGTVVATQKHEALEGIKLLIVQPMTPDGKAKGQPVVAADGTAMAGPGETIFMIGGREGALVLEKWFTPVDHGIVGIVDDVYVAVRGASEGATVHLQSTQRPRRASRKAPRTRRSTR